MGDLKGGRKKRSSEQYEEIEQQGAAASGGGGGRGHIGTMVSIASHLKYCVHEDVSHFVISQLLARH